MATRSFSQLFARRNLVSYGNPLRSSGIVGWRNWWPRRSFHGTRAVDSGDYYGVLGVSSDSHLSDIKKAYHFMAKKLHPDINKDDTDTQRKFQEIQRAYEVLKDEEKRSVYDQIGHEAYERDDSGENTFRERKDIGEDVKGCKKTVTYEADIPCKPCNGTGVPPGTIPQTCKSCKGSGVISVQEDQTMLRFVCSRCNGSGKIVRSFCNTCKGEQIVKGTKSVKVDVLPGMDNDETIRVYGSGGADPNREKPGDLFITIKIRDDPVFRRKGSDIHVDAAISFTQATKGATIRVPTLTGDFTVKVKPGTQTGQKIILKGKGIKARKSAVLGNQHVHFNVSVPKTSTQKQEECDEDRAVASG